MGVGMRARALATARIALVLGMLTDAAALAAPLSTEELAVACAQTEGSAHCARKVEEIQLKRLPNLATRDGGTLKVSLYPTGVATFADTEALNGGKSFALWDFVSEINTVVLRRRDDAVLHRLLGDDVVALQHRLAPGIAGVIVGEGDFHLAGVGFRGPCEQGAGGAKGKHGDIAAHRFPPDSLARGVDRVFDWRFGRGARASAALTRQS